MLYWFSRRRKLLQMRRAVIFPISGRTSRK